MLKANRQSRSRNYDVPSVALFAIAVAGVGLMAVRGKRDRARHLQGNAMAIDDGLRRSLTIMADAAELREKWRLPRTLAQMLEPAIEIEPGGGGGSHWRLPMPLGRTVEWDMEAVEEGETLIWRSTSGVGMPREIEASFRPATGGRGTVMTLRLDFAPPLGAVGDAALRLFAKPIRIAAFGALYRFRALVQTGEVPRTAPQPAARNGGTGS